MYKGLLLLAGASVLFVSAITKYVVAIFIPPLVLYVFFRNRMLSALLFFLLPLVIFIFLYVYFAIYPVGEILSESFTSLYDYSQVSFRTLSDVTFRWIAMPYLLTIFGIFHEEKGKIALVLFLLSTPIILLHLVTGVEQSVNRDVIFCYIFLAPAAALGVNHLGNMFSLTSPNLWVKPFFVAAILVVLWVFGFQELKWLEKQSTNMAPVIDFFKKKGFDGMTVTIDSNYGIAVYTYSLGSYYPRARFMSIAELDSVDNLGRPLYEKSNFIVFDGYYSKKILRNRALYHLRNNYFLMENFTCFVGSNRC